MSPVASTRLMPTTVVGLLLCRLWEGQLGGSNWGASGDGSACNSATAAKEVMSMYQTVHRERREGGDKRETDFGCKNAHVSNIAARQTMVRAQCTHPPSRTTPPLSFNIGLYSQS